MARLPDPDAVLRGRVRLDATALAELIHLVNPTDKGLSRAERERRYTQKSALQSLLIRQHPDSVSVERDPAHPDTVVLRHRLTGRDAGHARPELLDADARGWVEAQLLARETTPSGGPQGRSFPAAPPRRAEADTSEDPLTAANAAIEAYDYELAERILRAAQDGTAPPARLLLDLLVNHLADDASAWALRSSLGAATTDPEVRRLLALAAGRLGHEDAVRNLGAVGAEPWAVLVEVVGEAEALVRCLAELRELDPAHPALHRGAARLRALRASGFVAEEAEIQGRWKAGDLEAAAGQARALLERWPDSEVARQVVRDWAVRARAEAVQKARTARDEAMNADDLDRLVTAIRELERLGEPPGEAALVRRADLVTRRQDEVRDAQIVGLVRDFGERPDATALQKWCLAPPEVRAAVTTLETTWLRGIVDLPSTSGPVSSVVQSAITAVIALRQAIEEDDPAPVVAFRERLRSLAVAREAFARWDTRARQQLFQQEHAALDLVEQRLRATETAAMGLEVSRKLVDELEPLVTRSRSPEGQIRARALLDRARRRWWDLGVRDTLARGDLVTAFRQAVASEAAYPDVGLRQRVLDHIDLAPIELHDAACGVVPTSDITGPILGVMVPDMTTGRSLLVHTRLLGVEPRELLVRVFDEDQLVRVVLLRLGAWLGRISSVRIEATGLRVHGAGVVLDLDWPTLRPVSVGSWPGGPDVTSTPGAPWLWETRNGVHLHDLARGVEARSYSRYIHLNRVRGAPQPMYAASRWEGTEIIDARGGVLPQLGTLPILPNAAAWCQGRVVAAGIDVEDGDEHQLEIADTAGHRAAVVDVEGSASIVLLANEGGSGMLVTWPEETLWIEHDTELHERARFVLPPNVGVRLGEAGSTARLGGPTAEGLRLFEPERAPEVISRLPTTGVAPCFREKNREEAEVLAKIEAGEVQAATSLLWELPMSRHARHLEVMLELRRGDLSSAELAILAAEGLEGSCDLDRWMVLVGAARDPASWVSKVRAAVGEAAQARANGDWPRVMSLLSTPIVWAAGDPESTAWLAEAWRHVGGDSPEEQLQRRLAEARAAEAAVAPIRLLPGHQHAGERDNLAEEEAPSGR